MNDSKITPLCPPPHMPCLSWRWRRGISSFISLNTWLSSHIVFSHSWWLQFAYGFGNERGMTTGTPAGLDYPMHEVSNCPGCSLKLRLIPKWCFMGCVILLGPILFPEYLVLQNLGREKERVGNGWRKKRGKESTITESLLCTSDNARCHDTHCSFPTATLKERVWFPFYRWRN